LGGLVSWIDACPPFQSSICLWHECDLRAAPTNVRSWESNGLNAYVAFGPFMFLRTDIGRIAIPQCSALLSHCDVVSLGWRHRSLPTAPIPHQSLGRKALFDVRRREFIKVLGGAAATWPLAAGAHQGERMRRIGELMPFAENDPEAQTRVGRFPTGPAAIGMDRRPQRADRLPLGRGCHGDDRWRHRPEAVLKATQKARR
jgi:hypothetical protein